MKAAVIVFPGSNCDRDVAVALNDASGKAPAMVWHGETSLPSGTDLVVLPGGFSYGDYLRCGAMAARAPIMDAVRHHANKGGLVLGICNGFQILTETGLLPGTLLPNASLRFICRDIWLKVEHTNTPFTRGYSQGQIVNFPIAHHDGNYFADDATLQMLENEGRVVFRYATADGHTSESANPNGARHNIAGITNAKRNVLGMMPHPERHADSTTGGVDGKVMFHHLLAIATA